MCSPQPTWDQILTRILALPLSLFHRDEIVGDEVCYNVLGHHRIHRLGQSARCSYQSIYAHATCRSSVPIYSLSLTPATLASVYFHCMNERHVNGELRHVRGRTGVYHVRGVYGPPKSHSLVIAGPTFLHPVSIDRRKTFSSFILQTVGGCLSTSGATHSHGKQ